MASYVSCHNLPTDLRERIGQLTAKWEKRVPGSELDTSEVQDMLLYTPFSQRRYNTCQKRDAPHCELNQIVDCRGKCSQIPSTRLTLNLLDAGNKCRDVEAASNPYMSLNLAKRAKVQRVGTITAYTFHVGR